MLTLRAPKDIHVQSIRIGNVPTLILRPQNLKQNVPGVLWIHGGGYLLGMKEMVYMDRALDLVREYGAVVVSPGYRLSIQAPYPAALEDCHEVLQWMKNHYEELGIRSDQIMIGGESAGGGLCAALAILARDRGTVNPAFMMPLYPMIDYRDTESSKDNHGKVWNTRRNHLGWNLYLRGTKEILSYASPAVVDDVSGLPPCYTFVGDGEPFYAETLTFVERLKQAGIEAAVDVYSTDTHAFDMLHPGWEISIQARARFLEQFEYAMNHYTAPQM